MPRTPKSRQILRLDDFAGNVGCRHWGYLDFVGKLGSYTVGTAADWKSGPYYLAVAFGHHVLCRKQGWFGKADYQ